MTPEEIIQGFKDLLRYAGAAANGGTFYVTVEQRDVLVPLYPQYTFELLTN